MDETNTQIKEKKSHDVLRLFIFILVVVIIACGGYYIVNNYLLDNEDNPVIIDDTDEIEKNEHKENETIENKTIHESSIIVNGTEQFYEDDYDYDCNSENKHLYGNDKARRFSKIDLYVGGISLDTPKNLVTSILGEDYKTNGNSIEYPGLSIDFYEDEKYNIFRVSGIYISNEGIMTNRGIIIGSSVDDVLNAYKKENIAAYKEIKTKNGYECYSYDLSSTDEIEVIVVNESGVASAYENSGEEISFGINNGKVSFISIWQGTD